MKTERKSLLKEKSLLKRISTLLITAAVTLSTIPVIPQSVKNDIIANADGESANGGGYNSASHATGNTAGGANFGYRFYLINAEGQIVRARLYYMEYYGITINKNAIFEGDNNADAYAADLLAYYIMQADKRAAEDVHTAISSYLDNTHCATGDDAYVYETTVDKAEEDASPSYDDPSLYKKKVSGSNYDIYKKQENSIYLLNDIVGAGGVIETHWASSEYKYNKNGLINKIKSSNKIVESKKDAKNKTFTGKDYITVSNANAYLKNYSAFVTFDYNDSGFSVPSNSSKWLHINTSKSLFVPNNTAVNGTDVKLQYDSTVGNMVADVYATWNSNRTSTGQVSGKEDAGLHHINDLRFPIDNTSSSAEPYPGATYNAGELASYVSPLSSWPGVSTAPGDKLKEWMYAEPNKNIGDAITPIVGADRNWNKFAIYGNLFLPFDTGGSALLRNSLGLFNGASKMGGFEEDTSKMTALQKKYTAFQLVVEPIVHMPLRNNDDYLYNGHFNGTWTGYMRALAETWGEDAYGGAWTMQPAKALIGYGYYCDVAGVTNEEGFLYYGDNGAYIDAVAEDEVRRGQGAKAFYKKSGYQFFFNGDDGRTYHNSPTVDSTGNRFESTPFGMQIYWVSGVGGGTAPESDVINTFAVDNPPNTPERPEFSHNESGTGTGITNSSHPYGGTGTGNSKTNGDDTFEIVKIYADLYKDASEVAYASDEESVKNLKNGSEDKYYTDARPDSPTYGEAALVDRDGNLYSSVTATDSDGFAIAGTKIASGDKTTPCVVAKERLFVPSIDERMFNEYYTGIRQTGYYTMSNTSRNVFITEELDKTSLSDIGVNGYQLVSWHTSEFSEKGMTNNYKSNQYSVDQWLTLDAANGNNHGGYKLDLNFTRTNNLPGSINETDFRYDPTEQSHLYSRLYEDQNTDGCAPLGAFASSDGSICINDTNQHTIYLLYVRELPYIDTDGAGSGTGSGSGSGERTTDTNNGGKGTGTSGSDEKLPQHKFNIVKVYGVINPYTYKVTPTAVYAQSKNTYNVRIRDEYNTSYELGEGVVDTSNYHLRAYAVTDSKPSQVYGKTFPDGSIANGSMIILSDSITIGSPVEGARTINISNSKSITPSASMFDADHWADGWTNFKSEDYADNTKIVEYDNRGFIDGYDGVAWSDRGLSIANTSLTPVMSSAMKTDEAVFLDSSLHLPGYTGSSEPLYVYTPEGYDRTIYFGNKSDGGYKNEGTLYLLYLQGDILDYSGAVVIPESYITRRFDLAEVDVKISGAIQGTDTTSEGNHSIASHRFRISTPNIQGAIAASGFRFLAPNDWSFTSPDYYPSSTGWTRSSSLPSGWGTANPPNNIGAMNVRYNYIDRKNIVIDFIGINDVAMNIGLDFDDSRRYSKSMLDRGLSADEDSLVDASGLFNSMTVMHRIVPDGFDPLKDCSTLDLSDPDTAKKYKVKDAYVVNTHFINREFLLTGDDYVSGQDAHGAAKNGRNWAQAHTYQFNGLSCEIVLGRVDDPVTVAGWKYGLASEVKRTAIIKWVPGTGPTHVGRGYSKVADLNDKSRYEINKIINLEDTSYFTDPSANYYVTDITYIGSDSGSNLLTALVEYREIAAHANGTWEVYTTHSKQITSDNFNCTDTSLTELESNLLKITLGGTVVFDSIGTNKTSIANLSNLWSSSDYIALLNANKNYVSALGGLVFGQLKRPSELSTILTVTGGLSEQSTKPVIVDNVARVTRSSYGVQRSEAIDAFNLKAFKGYYGDDVGLDKANIPDGVNYNGHPVKSANRKDFNFFIGPIGYLSSDAAAAYGSTMGNSHQFLDREIAYYSVKTRSVPETVTRTNEDGTTDTYTTFHTEYQYTRYRRNEPLVFEDATKLDLTLSSYAYSYSGITGTPYYIQNSGVYLQDALVTARIRADIDYDFTNPELKNDAGSQSTGRWLPVVNYIELFESTEEKIGVGNLKYYASITNEPVKSIILNNDNAYEMGIRKSALAENHAVVFYPYYLMQYETNSSYNKGADGQFEANPLLIAGSYSRMFVPDEYQGVKLHDGNGTINFNVPVYVVNNGATDAAGKINITSEQWSTHATANATIGKQNCVLPGGAMFGVMIKNENRRYVDVETYAPILPDGDGRKHIEATAGGSTHYSDSAGNTIDASGINDVLAADGSGDATGGLPKAYEGSEFEQRHAELQKSVEAYMGSLNIDTYVDKQSNGSVDVSGKYNSAGEDNAEHYLSGHTDLSANPDNLVSQEDIKKIQKNDGKYYLREENNTTSDANAADLDVGVVDETKMFYTFFTTVDGRVLCHVSTTAEDSAKTTSTDYNNLYGHMASTTNTVPATNSLGDPGQVYVVLDRGQQVDTLTGLWKDFNDKTNVVTKLCEALERNHGYDPQSYYKRNGVLSDADVSYSGWYNEAFDGITYVKHVTKLAVGFVDPFERSAVLDPTLTPTQSGKEDMFSKYNAAQFMTADHCLQAIEDGYTDGMGTTTDGETISVIGKLDINGKAYEVGIDPEKLKKLFISDIFFIPNATVQDLK